MELRNKFNITIPMLHSMWSETSPLTFENKYLIIVINLLLVI